MPASTLSPYKNNSNAVTFYLTSSSDKGALWLEAGRATNSPSWIEIQRKLTQPNAAANDHLVLRIGQTAPNATTGKLSTQSATLDISVPKDQTVLTKATLVDLLGLLVSLLNDVAANAATSTIRTALAEGRLIN